MAKRNSPNSKERHRKCCSGYPKIYFVNLVSVIFKVDLLAFLLEPVYPCGFVNISYRCIVKDLVTSWLDTSENIIRTRTKSNIN